MKGYIQVYTGDGKGKTTAAFGLALRAAGSGLKVCILQFMKGAKYGEIESINQIPGIELEQYGWENCIKREEVDDVHKAKTRKGLKLAYDRVSSQQYDIVILDEILVAIWFNLISEREVLDFINWHPRTSELILTGRKATKEIIRIADLVTEMKCVKHYFDKGITARKGIEL